MAITGLGLILFLIAHLAANLLIFSSPKAFNDYSHGVVSNPLVYVAEALLLFGFVAHFVAGIAVTLANRSARPVGYAVRRRAGYTSHKSLASTTMIVSGLLLLVFVPFHLWTFKFGPYYESAAPGVRDLHRLVIEVFQQPLYVAFYVVALGITGFHLAFGFESAWQSLGVRYGTWLRRIGQILATVVTVGFILIPLLIFFVGAGR